jgi:hypothetical protein
MGIKRFAEFCHSMTQRPVSDRIHVLMTRSRYLLVSSTAGSFLPTVMLTRMRSLMQPLIPKIVIWQKSN